MSKHHQVRQNTDEWDALRLGKFTASVFKDLFMAKSTAGYKKAIYQVVFERLAGESPESFQSAYMERGHDMEVLARDAYELQTFNTVNDGGFWEMNEWVGASPDGLVGEDGLVEIKSPAYNTMIDYLIKPKLPTIYRWQVHGQLMVTGRQWCDFMCFHPKLKPLIIRIDRDDGVIKELTTKIEESIAEAKKILKAIQ